MRRILLSAFVSAALAAALPAQAKFSIPGFELVQPAPGETTLHSDDR